MLPNIILSNVVMMLVLSLVCNQMLSWKGCELTAVWVLRDWFHQSGSVASWTDGAVGKLAITFSNVTHPSGFNVSINNSDFHFPSQKAMWAFFFQEKGIVYFRHQQPGYDGHSSVARAQRWSVNFSVLKCVTSWLFVLSFCLPSQSKDGWWVTTSFLCTRVNPSRGGRRCRHVGDVTWRRMTFHPIKTKLIQNMDTHTSVYT